MEYQVLFIGDMEQRKRELASQGAAHGQDILAAYDRIVLRLRQDPLARGELLYHLISNDEPAHHYIDAPLSMWFVIHVAFRAVWVYRLDRLSAADESPPDPL
jgi:hypothetical protein